MSDFEKSNGNIFDDLGDPEAKQTLVRAQILSRIIDIVNERNFTETETAETLGISKLEASQLIKGKLSQFFLEDLFSILNALDKDIEIILKPKVDTQAAKIRVLIEL
ncbi:helix-turn-helix domain-containing protein [Aphanothece sacrum]|uniref:XRE family transcriptional regulator n=1 Tax=Aphanothece sacrum FPU1 TaxID=1920663 RepID=A0A401IM77_APHSA|nr:XRE family transcriptional regulator [Aphanothece sacrum]GBF82357.1 XRE family transcriptional regulator [Aphanothece sacrum FPU1]GBF84257.1 transcriptional regulator, XRE family [Aphanothece sacrum FPU3]